jgi:hypothetical protein
MSTKVNLKQLHKKDSRFHIHVGRYLPNYKSLLIVIVVRTLNLTKMRLLVKQKANE